VLCLWRCRESNPARWNETPSTAPIVAERQTEIGELPAARRATRHGLIEPTGLRDAVEWGDADHPPVALPLADGGGGLCPRQGLRSFWIWRSAPASDRWASSDDNRSMTLIGRGAITHSILRPAWFMQDFSETFLKPVDGVIAVPTADGSEAFIDAEDIAAVAAETLASPDAHAGAAYALTGPEAITVSEAAELIARAIGRPVKHDDIDREMWIQGSVAAGVPAEYGETLRTLTKTIASGMGSRPNDTVQKVTGAPPTTFADFARRAAQAWT
jgi:hypothetical protein